MKIKKIADISNKGMGQASVDNFDSSVAELESKINEAYKFLEDCTAKEVSELESFISLPETEVMNKIEALLGSSKVANRKLIKKIGTDKGNKDPEAKLKDISPHLDTYQLERYNRSAPSNYDPRSWSIKARAIYRFLNSDSEPLRKKACFYSVFKGSSLTVMVAPLVFLESISELKKEGFFSRATLSAGLSLGEVAEEGAMFVGNTVGSITCFGAIINFISKMMERVFLVGGISLVAWLFDRSNDESWKQEYKECLPGFADSGVVQKTKGILKRQIIKILLTQTLRLIPVIGELLSRLVVAKPGIEICSALYDKWVKPYEAGISLEAFPILEDPGDKSNKSLDSFAINKERRKLIRKFSFRDDLNLSTKQDRLDVELSQINATIEGLESMVADLASGQSDSISEVQDLIALPEGEAISRIEGMISLSKSSNLKNSIRKKATTPDRGELEVADRKKLEVAGEASFFASASLRAKAIHRFLISEEESTSKKACFFSVLKDSNMMVLVNPLIMLGAFSDLKKEGLLTRNGFMSLLSGVGAGALFVEELSVAGLGSAMSAVPVIGSILNLLAQGVEKAIFKAPSVMAWLGSVVGVEKAWDGAEDFKECIEGGKNKAFFERKINSATKASVAAGLQVGAQAARTIPVVGELAAMLVEGIPMTLLLICLYNKWVKPYEAQLVSEKDSSLSRTSSYKDRMIQKKINNIAKFLGENELYKEAYQLQGLIKR